MKSYFILLISILFVFSCSDDSTVKYVEVPVDTLKTIKFKHNLQESNFMTDVDTLKIEILDKNLKEYKMPFSNLLLVKGRLSPNITGRPNFAFEQINSDLRFEINPNNKYEIWITNLQPTIDSTRSHGDVSRYDYYTIDILFSLIDEYYKDSFFTFFVQSTTE